MLRGPFPVAQPDAALWPMAVAIALHGLNLYRQPEAQ